MRGRGILTAIVIFVGALGAASDVGGEGTAVPGSVVIGIYDPTGESPASISWPPYPAAPPSGFHWQHSGSPPVRWDPRTGQPVPGQRRGKWVLVRDGYTMPTMQ